MNEQNVEELKKKGAKLKACNERSRERIAEIAKTANDCLLNTIHPDPDGYVAGQYGQDYRTFGKAMCEIRKIVGDSIADVAPDYEMLARQFARPAFDADKLAKAIEALASEKPIDYPTFYTPGWRVDLAKKLVAEGKVKVEGEQRNETSAVHLNPSPSPVLPGCPSLGPKVFQSGADGTEPAAAGKNPFYEFYGLKLNRFGGAGLNSKLIGKRVNDPTSQPSVQVFEIDVRRGSLATGARAFVTENGELLFSIVGGKSFVAVEKMAISALHSLLKRRFDSKKRKNIRRARKAAAKRAAANC